MKQKVNYIVHHKEAFLKLMEEDVTAIDISIYNTLFLLWNNAEFDDKLSINRNEIMMMSKVGNANTYTKSLRKLDELGFIKYFPSNNPMRGSIITICRFDNSSDNSTEHSSGNTCDYSSDNSTEHSGDTLYKPYKLYKPINSINNKNKDSSLSENSEKHNSLKTQEQKKEKSCAKKEKAEMPFPSKEFDAQWTLWKMYRKKNHKFQFVNIASEQRELSKLKNESGNDEKTAIAMITQSIDKGWKGFFPLKNKTEKLQTSSQGEFNIFG